jgi:ABC-type transport system substrate-binding protein
MKHYRRRALALLLAVVMILPLCACSNNDNAQCRSDKTNTLYVGYVGTSFPSSYMPWQSRDGIAPTISSILYSTLFSYDDLTGLYEPLLADNWCYTDKQGNKLTLEDGSIDYAAVAETYKEEQSLSDTNRKKYMVVRVELNKDAKWSDGTPVTVDDVYFSFDLCANNKMSNHAGALAWVSDLKHKYDEGIKKSDGLFTYDYNPHNYPISEEEKDTVIYLHVNTVMGAVASLFTTVLILPKHIWEPVISPEMPINSTSPNEALTNLYQHPVGCGPYVLDREGTNAAQITLKKNPDYFRKAEDGSDLYKVDTIKFILYQEQNVAIFAIKKGYIDILDCSIPANYASLFEKEKDISVFSVPNVYAKALVLNINPVEGQKNEVRSLMSHENFRRAIALSINQEELIRNCLDGAGSTYSAGLISHTLDNLYNPDSDILRGDYEERLKEANAILDTFTTEKDELGYRLYNGKRISFEVLGNPGEQDTISFLQIQLQKVGIELKYAPAGSSPENTYLYHSRFDMTLQGITFSLGTVDIMMNSHFVNLNKSSNYGRLVNDELAAKIDVMRNTLNMDEKTALLKEMQMDIAQLYYKIPLYSANVTSVARTDRFQGYVVAPSQTAFSLETLRHLEFVGG